jgi:hypothetical protein
MVITNRRSYPDFSSYPAFRLEEMGLVAMAFIHVEPYKDVSDD